MGSGAAGLVAACRTADAGLRVVVLEKDDLLDGTSAAGGGVMWAAANPLMAGPRFADQGRSYLHAVTDGAMPDDEIDWYLATSAALVGWLAGETRVVQLPLGRPDYHLAAPGAVFGRGLDNAPFDTASVPGLAAALRPPTYLPLLTMAEREASRSDRGVRTMGGALVGAIVASALDRSVTIAGWAVEVDGRRRRIRARSVVLASGGFEWSAELRERYLAFPVTPISAPSNEDDGLRLGLGLGADVRDTAAVWAVPVICPPTQVSAGQPGGRMGNVEHTLPGSIAVKSTGRRFANEALNYHDLCRVLGRTDDSGRHPNASAWLVFDERYRRRYLLAEATATEPPWWTQAPTLEKLAAEVGIDQRGLVETVEHKGVTTVSSRSTSSSPPGTLRVGIVGCGAISRNHIDAFQAADGVEVVAVSDVELSRAQAQAAAHDIPHAVETVEELLALGLDIVSVCTPHPTHEAIVSQQPRLERMCSVRSRSRSTSPPAGGWSRYAGTRASASAACSSAGSGRRRGGSATRSTRGRSGCPSWARSPR